MLLSNIFLVLGKNWGRKIKTQLARVRPARMQDVVNGFQIFKQVYENEKFLQLLEKLKAIHTFLQSCRPDPSQFPHAPNSSQEPNFFILFLNK